MANQRNLETFLAACTVDPEIFELRPDYRVLLLVVEGISPAFMESTAGAELIAQAENHARALLAASPVEELPHIAAWREAYRAFGAKPQRTRNSLEALTRRAENGLPRINALTDAYNAISVIHQLPLGGEDLTEYVGAARLLRARGTEQFDTAANGETVMEQPEPGEVIWQDEAGVTCRRWNWRQCRRTGLTDDTTTAFFIMDALDPVTDAQLAEAGKALLAALAEAGPQLRVAQRLIRA
ncbi:MAG: B3/B4 domain-containing protein [Propionibacteriaceae bacterium]